MCQVDFRPDSPLVDCNRLYKQQHDSNRAGPDEQRPGLFQQQQLVAVARLLPSQQEQAWLLRGLCVAQPYRGHKLGQTLLHCIHQYWPQHDMYLRPLSGLERYYQTLGYLPLDDEQACLRAFPYLTRVRSVMFRAARPAYTAPF